MRKLNGSVFLSLDGVMQAPGGPTEDWTGGFEHGGWLWSFSDDVTNAAVGELFSRPFDLLLGRKTYEIFAAYWPYVTGEEAGFAAVLNAATKHVLTRNETPLEWENSHRLPDIDAVRALKDLDGPDLLIQGSSTLYPQLLAAGLIDRLTILTFPVVLGTGKRLFGTGTPAGAMRTIDHKVSGTGVVIATYEPAGDVVAGSVAQSEPSEREKARQERMTREG